MTVEFLSKPACVQCVATQVTLVENNIDFTKIDMSIDLEARDLAKSLGFMQAPVILVRDEEGNIVEKWSGFHPEKIAALS